tara:strand:+ start:180 stop:533 length:354 start_codon:yes stop_codon:yes gene_type:complete
MANTTLITERSNNTLVAVEKTTNLLEIITAGPKGDKGEAGVNAVSTTYNISEDILVVESMTAVQSEYIIQHSAGRVVNVVVVDDTGSTVMAEVSHSVDRNSVTVRTHVPIVGTITIT